MILSIKRFLGTALAGNRNRGYHKMTIFLPLGTYVSYLLQLRGLCMPYDIKNSLSLKAARTSIRSKRFMPHYAIVSLLQKTVKINPPARLFHANLIIKRAFSRNILITQYLHAYVPKEHLNARHTGCDDALSKSPIRSDKGDRPTRSVLHDPPQGPPAGLPAPRPGSSPHVADHQVRGYRLSGYRFRITDHRLAWDTNLEALPDALAILSFIEKRDQADVGL